MTEHNQAVTHSSKKKSYTKVVTLDQNILKSMANGVNINFYQFSASIGLLLIWEFAPSPTLCHSNKWIRTQDHGLNPEPLKFVISDCVQFAYANKL